ncbi:hypothetical protein J3F83DRAFT_724182 [Trichoderma novae-zelandiae]
MHTRHRKNGKKKGRERGMYRIARGGLDGFSSRLPLGQPTLKPGSANSPPLTTSSPSRGSERHEHDDERFRPLVQLPLPPMMNHVGCVCRAVRASRCGSVPSYLVLPGDAEPGWLRGPGEPGDAVSEIPNSSETSGQCPMNPGHSVY